MWAQWNELRTSKMVFETLNEKIKSNILVSATLTTRNWQATLMCSFWHFPREMPFHFAHRTEITNYKLDSLFKTCRRKRHIYDNRLENKNKRSYNGLHSTVVQPTAIRPTIYDIAHYFINIKTIHYYSVEYTHMACVPKTVAVCMCQFVESWSNAKLNSHFFAEINSQTKTFVLWF